MDHDFMLVAAGRRLYPDLLVEMMHETLDETQTRLIMAAFHKLVTATKLRDKKRMDETAQELGNIIAHLVRCAVDGN